MDALQPFVFWQQDLVLKPVIIDYLNGFQLDLSELNALKRYIKSYIQLFVGDVSFSSVPGGKEGMLACIHDATQGDIDKIIDQLLEAGIDPL